MLQILTSFVLKRRECKILSYIILVSFVGKKLIILVDFALRSAREWILLFPWWCCRVSRFGEEKGAGDHAVCAAVLCVQNGNRSYAKQRPSPSRTARLLSCQCPAAYLNKNKKRGKKCHRARRLISCPACVTCGKKSALGRAHEEMQNFSDGQSCALIH